MSKFSFNSLEEDVQVALVTKPAKREKMVALTSNGAKVIRKYDNGKLYDPERRSYITGQDVKNMIKSGVQFVVLDHKTNSDVTVNVLAGVVATLAGNTENLKNSLVQVIRNID